MLIKAALLVLGTASLGVIFVSTAGEGRVAPRTAVSRAVPPRQIKLDVDSLVRDYPDPLLATLKRFKKAVDDFDHDRFAECLDEIPGQAAVAATAVADLALWYRGRACLEVERPRDAFEAFHTLRVRYPDSLVLADALRGESRALLDLDKPAEALAVLDEGKLAEDSEALSLRAQTLERQGKRAEAVRLYLRIFSDRVNSSESAEAGKRLHASSRSFLRNGDNYPSLLQRGINLVRAGRYSEARSLLVHLSRVKAPDAASERKRLLAFAQADYGLQRVSEAIRYLKRIDARDPEIHVRAIHLEGLCYRRLGREESFSKCCEKALRLYPSSSFTERLLYSLATYYELDGRRREAEEAYRKIADRFPQGSYRERATWKLAFFSYLEEHYPEALKGFWNYLLAYPDPGSASASLYWMGRACQSMGSARQAAYFYRSSEALSVNGYYGLRARQAEGSLKGAESDGPPPEIPGLDFDRVRMKVDRLRLPQPAVPRISGEAQKVVERARQLLAADLPDLALDQVNRGISRFPEDTGLRYVASRVCFIKEDFYGAISTLRRNYPNYIDRSPSSLPDEIWELFFPVRHWETISLHAAKDGVDPSLILGLIRQESSFNARARSRANARGLMQLLPSTARHLARQSGIRYTTPRLYRPETNIALGVKYLASLLQRYGGRVELALAAYNAGYNRVDRWLEDFGSVDMAEFVECIPLGETRGYVKQVVSNQAHYRLRSPAVSGSTR